MAKKTSRVQLRPQDPFDLIRLLARSQSDPRKAIAELVQNSLDAGARRIEIQWFNEKGRRAISIWDDGAGVFPEMERSEALRRIAQTIGHSHKRDLSPAQRREELILGKYGIGLIGFWSVGEVLEMRSRVGGEPAQVLRLVEDRAQGEVFTSRARRLDEIETSTEITIRGVHEAALSKVRPPRLQAFLATELRGQLLVRDAVVRIRDRVARGRAKKEFVVKPEPYLGRPIEGLTTLDVPGYESARLELYHVAVDEERRGRVALSCGGTVVLDDIAEIDGVDEPRQPWFRGRFEGVIDFPDLHVAPASRRGFSHDEPVAAFLESLAELEQALVARLADEEVRRDALRSQHVANQIRRAFVSVAEALPEYDFFDIRASVDGAMGDGPVGGAAMVDAGEATGGGTHPHAATGHEPLGASVGANPVAAPASEAAPPPLGESPTGPPGLGNPPSRQAGANATETENDSPPSGSQGASEDTALLFPPGPLAKLTLRPARARLGPGESRVFMARAVDADGRDCEEPIEFKWTLDGPGQLGVDGARANYAAPLELREEVKATLRLTAHHAGASASAAASITIAPPDVTARVQGIPEPYPISAPGESWRSRLRDGRWEFNEAHRDFQAVAEVEAQRVRYLIHLFAKEVVLRNFGRPGDAEVLERMVEVLTRLRGK